jgi:hypothetical protein
METLTTAQAAEMVGVNVQKLFRLIAREGIAPVFEAPGKRGAKFWNPRDIERLIASDELAS